MLPRCLRLIASLMAALCLCVALALALALGAVNPAHAATTATRNYPGTAPCDTTLQACINGSNDGDEIAIAAGLYITSIDLSKNLRLRGVSSATTILQALPNRKVITASAALNPGFQMEIMSLTVRGGSSDSSGDIIAQNGAGILHRGAAPLLIASVLITGNGLSVSPLSGGGLFITNNTGPATLVGTAFVNNKADEAGAIYAMSPLTVINGYFDNNSCLLLVGCSGGAIHTQFFATLVISDSALFIRNHSPFRGGAIGSTGPLIVKGRSSSAVRFEGNTTPSAFSADGGHGGAIYAEGNLTLTGATFVSNTAIGDGGAILVSGGARAVLGGPAVVDGLSFSSNSAGGTGGAIAVLGNTTASTNRIFPTANSAGNGGGLYIGPSAVVSIETSNFTGNTATVGSGGAILNHGSLTLIPNGGFDFSVVFMGNQAATLGGGIATTGTLAIINAPGGQRALMQANTAGSSGGGLFAQNTVQLESLSVISNAAPHGFGGGMRLDSRGLISNVTIERNNALVGGGLFVGGNITVGNAVISANVSGFHGGGIENVGVLTFLRTEPGGQSILLTQNRSGTSGDGGAIVNFGSLIDRRLGGARVGLVANTSDGKGGGIYSSSPVSLEGWDVISNTANASGLGSGGGIYLQGSGLISDTLIQQNASASDGGGIYVIGADLVNSQVISNTAGGPGSNVNGGGVYNAGFGSITGTLIQNNQSSGLGGGAFSGAFLNMADSQVVSNSATAGGGLYLVGDNTTSQIVNSRVERNSATTGGGLYNDAPTVIARTDFYQNRAQDGGGAYLAGRTQIAGGLWSNNTAITLGGAIFYSATTGFFSGTDTLGVTATQFISNRALNGGGLFLRGNDARIVNTLLARNTATGGTVGAAIAIFAGNTRILHATIADRVLNPKDAINTSVGTVNISNTIITSHTTGIRRSSGTTSEDYSRFFGNTTNLSGLAAGTHSATADQHFANQAADDYRLTASSGTAINTGFNFGVATDFEGNPRSFGGAPDIGYDEYALQVYLPLIRR